MSFAVDPNSNVILMKAIGSSLSREWSLYSALYRDGMFKVECQHSASACMEYIFPYEVCALELNFLEENDARSSTESFDLVERLIDAITTLEETGVFSKLLEIQGEAEVTLTPVFRNAQTMEKLHRVFENYDSTIAKSLVEERRSELSDLQFEGLRVMITAIDKMNEVRSSMSEEMSGKIDKGRHLLSSENRKFLVAIKELEYEIVKRCRSESFALEKRFRTDSMKLLEESFFNEPYPVDKEKERLALLTGHSVKQVSTWFTNKRARNK